MARILVVEDDTAIRGLIVNLLTEEGHVTDEAGDGLVALDKVRGSPPDLVVLDLFMPRVDGFEFLNLCRMLPACASTPVVVLSASDRLPVDKRVRAFLKKPFDLNALATTVDSLLDQPRPQLP